MLKRTILIILPFVIVLGLAGWYIMSKKTGPQGGSGGSSSGGNILSNLFPSGGDNTSSNQPTPAGGGSNNGSSGTALAPGGLRQLTRVPVAGFIGTTTANGYVIRYVERTTGNVYEIGGSGSTRLTNTTIPAVYEALWDRSAQTVALRYLNENNVIKTYLANIAPPATTSTSTVGSLTGTYLSDDIPYMTENAHDNALLYVVPNGSGATGRESFFSATKDVSLFDSPFGEWLLSSADDGTLLATTKPSATTDGFAYEVSKDGSFLKVLGNIKGLTAQIDPTGEAVLYSESSKKSFTTKLFNIQSDASIALPLNTLPEKCAWSPADPAMLYCGVPAKVPSGDYPDAWYQGTVSFDDTIGEVDTKTDTIRFIGAPSADTPIDVIHPMVSADGGTLYFINKKDSTLWSLSIPTSVDATGTATTTDESSS